MKDSIMNDIRPLDFPLESIEYYKTESTNIMTIKNSLNSSWTMRYQRYVYLAGSIYDLQYVFLTVVFQLGGKCWEKWQSRS